MGAGKSPRRRREKQFHNKEKKKKHTRSLKLRDPRPSPPSRPTFLKRWPVLQRQAPLREESRLLKDPPRSIFSRRASPQPLTCFLSGSKLSSEKPLPFFLRQPRRRRRSRRRRKKKKENTQGFYFGRQRAAAGRFMLQLRPDSSTALFHSSFCPLSVLSLFPSPSPSVATLPPPPTRPPITLSPLIFDFFPSSFCLFEANMWGLMYTGTHSHTHQLTGTPLKSLIPT